MDFNSLDLSEARGAADSLCLSSGSPVSATGQGGRQGEAELSFDIHVRWGSGEGVSLGSPRPGFQSQLCHSLVI